MANQNPFRPLVHWIVKPPYATRFVSMADGSIDVEFEPGREDEVADYIHAWVDAHRERSNAMREAADYIHAWVDAHRERSNAMREAAAPPVMATPTTTLFDPNCASCAWAKEHPKTSCSIHSLSKGTQKELSLDPIQDTKTGE